MPIITSIKPQKKKDRVNIYLDGKFGFGLDLENFMKINLKVEQELTNEEVEKIIKIGEFKKTHDKLLGFATLRPRSKKEIEDWFRRKKVHESMHKKLLNRLKKFELVDDEKFAEWWIDQRLRFKQKSKRELALELRVKGIDKNIIDDVFSVAKIDDLKAVKKLIEKKEYRWNKFSKEEADKKKTEFLLRRGFSWETIKKVIK